jgi:hypothetical protein
VLPPPGLSVVLFVCLLFACCSGRAECLLGDVWERLRVLCSQNCEAQRYDFGSVLERAAELGAKRLIICDPGESLLFDNRMENVLPA